MMQLRIYEVAIEMVAGVSVLATQIARSDIDLARQVRRSSASVPLNIAEGAYGLGGNRAARFHDAMGSARETMAALEVAVAAGYVGAASTTELLDRLDRIVATLWKLTHR